VSENLLNGKGVPFPYSYRKGEEIVGLIRKYKIYFVRTLIKEIKDVEVYL